LSKSTPRRSTDQTEGAASSLGRPSSSSRAKSGKGRFTVAVSPSQRMPRPAARTAKLRATKIKEPARQAALMRAEHRQPERRGSFPARSRRRRAKKEEKERKDI